MLNRQPFYRKIAIAGRVKNAITSEGISGAVVKIVDAPDEFIDLVIFQTKLLGLPSLPVHGPLLNSPLISTEKPFPQQLQHFRIALEEPKLKTADRLSLFQSVLEDSTLSNRHKFQAFQAMLDRLPVSLQGNKTQLERTQTAREGWFYFTNLPAGTYQLEAAFLSANRSYRPAQLKIKVEPKEQDTMSRSAGIASQLERIGVEFELKPTTLLGKVTSSEDQEAIGMAKVQVQGSRNHTLTASELVKQKQGEWNYRLVGIEARNTPLTVIVSARGYLTQQAEVFLQTGELKSLDFQLVPQ